MKFLHYSGLLVLIPLFVAGGLAASDSVFNNSQTIYVVNHGWHTGVILEKSAIPDSFLLSTLIPGSQMLEIGWGDYDFYRNPDPDTDVFLAIKAALWPTQSVLHVVGFNGPVRDYFPYSQSIEIRIKTRDFINMCNFIESAFARDSLGRFIDSGPGLYGNSRFFAGIEKYFFPHTCNVWTARVLLAAGLDIKPYGHQRAESVMKRLKKIMRANSSR